MEAEHLLLLTSAFVSLPGTGLTAPMVVATSAGRSIFRCRLR